MEIHIVCLRTRAAEEAEAAARERVQTANAAVAQHAGEAARLRGEVERLRDALAHADARSAALDADVQRLTVQVGVCGLRSMRLGGV